MKHVPPSSMVADAVESDFDYFRRHLNATIRNRLPFEGEFSAADLWTERGLDYFVHAIVQRGPDGQIRRARVLCFVEGGTA